MWKNYIKFSMMVRIKQSEGFTMKKEEKKNVIHPMVQKAFVKQFFSKVVIEEEKDYAYFGKMDVSDEHFYIPMEVMFADNFITFHWWYNLWAKDVEKFCEKMRNYIHGFAHGYFVNKYISVYEDCANEGRLTLKIDFD